MSKKTAKKVYEILVEGLYFANDGEKNVQKTYSVKANIGQKHVEAGALSVFKNLIAPDLMPQQYPDYQGLYTHELKYCRDVNNPDEIPNDPRLMNLPQLVAYIQHNELPIQVNLYADVQDLQQALLDYNDDAEQFLKAQDKRKELRGKDLELKAELAELNQGAGVGANLLDAKAAEEQAKLLDPANLPGQLKQEVKPAGPVDNSEIANFTADDLAKANPLDDL